MAWRPKSGYPASLTVGYQSALRQRANDLLTDSAAPVLQLVSGSKLAGLLAQHDGDLSEWTPLQHVAYVLELDAWLREHRVTIQ